MLVRHIRNIPTFSWEKNSAEYVLQPMFTGAARAPLTYLKDPTAETLPLLPACIECGVGSQPGQAGSAGWVCLETCSITTQGRVP